MEADAQLPPPAFNFQPLPTACDRHPAEQFTGFCASCLRERLAGLDGTNARRSCSNSAALKSIFRLTAGGGEPSFSSSFNPELRRCKSFAGGPSTAVVVEPQRKSCDARVRRTLWSLFHQDDRNRTDIGGDHFPISAAGAGEIQIEESVVIVGASNDLLGEKVSDDIRSMKEHIDLDSRANKPPPRDLKEIAGNFWLSASLIGKKLKKWRKQKLNKSSTCNGIISKGSTTLRLDEKKNTTNKSSRRFRDTQSEIAVDALGRRSCDIAPRFSLDAGRFSLDDPGCSWDEPRASWDGCLINGGRSVRSELPAKVSVINGYRISLEEDSTAPGCSAQTREYYSDSSNRRRRSLDRSSSKRKNSVDPGNIKPASNSKISELFHWSNLEQESKVWNSVSFREDYSQSFDSAFRDPILKPPPEKKSCRWSVWGFLHRRSQSRGRGSEMVERSFSETWPEHRENGHGGKILRSNSGVGARRSFSNNDGITSFRNGCLETGGSKKKKKSKEFVLDRSRSSRYSPSRVDNGLLRFYLTPLRGSWRRGISPKSKFSSPASFRNSILRLY